MKTKFISGAFLLGLVAFTSCGKSESTITQTYNLNAVNLITDVTDGSTFASEGWYYFDLTISDMKGSVAASNLILNNTAVNFTSAVEPYTSTGYDIYFKNLTVPSQNVTDGNFLLSPYFYFPKMYNITSADMYVPQASLVLIANYNVGENYKVKTFQKNTFYVGKTTTQYNMMGVDQTYETEDIYYQLSLDLKESKAQLLMFNAKFSNVEQEPKKAQINLNDLKVEYTDGVIKVYGENIIPEVVEGNATTPNEDFIFNTIEFTTTSEDLTQCEIKYQVAGRFYGSFTGAYADTSYLKK
ncbi:MAG: hypothetical protein J1F12_05340 [Muribaculaceae bacterium]|nr:hypothetical protein [Muribaculaceae bacterium]